MIQQLLKELHETWGYETEELNDIREKLEEFANATFWVGYHAAVNELEDCSFSAYGKMEDFE